jgi:hypothetical protein
VKVKELIEKLTALNLPDMKVVVKAGFDDLEYVNEIADVTHSIRLDEYCLPLEDIMDDPGLDEETRKEYNEAEQVVCIAGINL